MRLGEWEDEKSVGVAEEFCRELISGWLCEGGWMSA